MLPLSCERRLIGKAITRDARKGDQIMLKVLVMAKNWTYDRKGRLGALRGDRGSPNVCHVNPPIAPSTDAAEPNRTH
jgi:hypothetical protein